MLPHALCCKRSIRLFLYLETIKVNASANVDSRLETAYMCLAHLQISERVFAGSMISSTPNLLAVRTGF